MKRLLLTLLTFLVGGALGVVLTLQVQPPTTHMIARCRRDAGVRPEWTDHMTTCLTARLGWSFAHADDVVAATFDLEEHNAVATR